MNEDLIERLRSGNDEVFSTRHKLLIAGALEEAEHTAQFNFEQYQDAAHLLCEANEKLEIAIVVMENLVTVKGRYHTEQAYSRIVEALKVLKQTKGSE